MTAPTAPALRRPTTSPAFVEGLRRHGDRVALVTDAETLTYTHLADRVAAAAERLGHGRRLVLVETGNDVASVVAYLAALHGGHAVVLADRADRARLAALTARFDPDVVVADGVPRQRRAGSRHTLHPELALLLATSGSSGAPRLVRLSPSALSANAAAIATALDIDPDDRAALTLPIHYCYGLSVLHSNLLVGAAIVLSDRSVLNPRFWESAREQRVTSLHGVPYSFELFDAVGFADTTLPDLRYVTVAGGRLEPAQVRRWAAVGRERGWDLVVMYGQTEATARMACLPPALAEQHPDAVGVAVPGSSLTVDAGPDGVGELVFAGPGVMLGYAEGPADLALGRTVAALRTGDLGRVGPDGLVRVVGRLARFVKPYGLRVDLDDVERLLAEHGVVAAVEGTDARIVVAARRDGSDDLASRVVALLAGRHGMPPETFAVEVVDVLPRRPNGKIDHPAVARLAERGRPRDEVRIPAQRTAPEPHRAPRRGGWRRLLAALGASTA